LVLTGDDCARVPKTHICDLSYIKPW